MNVSEMAGDEIQDDQPRMTAENFDETIEKTERILRRDLMRCLLFNIRETREKFEKELQQATERIVESLNNIDFRKELSNLEMRPSTKHPIDLANERDKSESDPTKKSRSEDATTAVPKSHS